MSKIKIIFIKSSLKERNFLECGNTGTNALDWRWAKNVSIRQQNKLDGDVIDSDWLMLISLGTGAIFNLMRQVRIKIEGWFMASISDAEP